MLLFSLWKLIIPRRERDGERRNPRRRGPTMPVACRATVINGLFLLPVMATVRRIDATYDSKREWRADPKGYFLIKLFPETGEIGVRYQDYAHEPRLDIYGKDAESIVQTVVREGLLSTLQHAAYLGHELHKAEVALRLGVAFVQDKPLALRQERRDAMDR